MFNIQTLTQRYDPVEDRIELSMRDPHQQVLRLWVTQRLANMMADLFIKHVDVGELSAEPAPPQEGTEQVAVKPVESSQAAESALVTSLDFNFEREAFSLVFKWGVMGHASIALTRADFVAYVRALYGIFDQAGWVTAVWTPQLTQAIKEAPKIEFELTTTASKLIH